MITLAAVTSCKRQTLESPEYLLAPIPIAIDWQYSQVPTSSIANVSAYFYPTNGGEPLVFISDNINFVLAELPIGEYDVMIFNEIAGNTAGMIFRDIDQMRWAKITAIEQPAILTSQMIYYEQPTEYVIDKPDPIASWSSDEPIVVTAEMIDYTHTVSYSDYITAAKAIANDPNQLKHATTKTSGAVSQEDALSHELQAIATIESLALVRPLPVTTECTVQLRVKNISNAQWIECVIRSFSTSVMLSERTASNLEQGDNPLLVFDFMSMAYDNGSTTDGIATHTLLTFGKQPDPQTEYELVLTAIISTGEAVIVTRDVTDQVNESSGKNITIDLTSTKNQMELPEGRADGFGVEDWGVAEDVELM